MELAVRDFVGDVSRFLDVSLSGGVGYGAGSWEASCRRQLEQLRRQLKQLLLRYPSLRPANQSSEPVSDDLYDDTGAPDSTAAAEFYDETGGQADLVEEVHYDDTGCLIAEDVYEEPSECYDRTLAPQETYDDLGPTSGAAAVTEQFYDDTVSSTEPYLPMVSKKAARTLGLAEKQTEGTLPSSASAGRLAASSVDPEVASLQSQTSQTSQESVPAEKLAAAQVCAAARRWGRLQLRQDSKLWPYRPYWAGLAHGRLYLYRRETDAAQKLAINLSGYEVRQPPAGVDMSAKRRPACFELVKPGGRTHQLLALTPKDVRQWMAALEAEGVMAGKSEPEPAEQPPPRPPPGPEPGLASSVAAAAAVPLKRSGPVEASPSEPEVEELYAEADDEDIYDDISWPAESRQAPHGSEQTAVEDEVIEEDIYEVIGNPGIVPPEPAWLAPVLPPAGRPTMGWTRALPAVPGQLSPESPESAPPPLPDRAPLAPPVQPPPPPPPQRGPAAPAQPPPQRGPAAPAQPPPQRSPAAPAQPPPPPVRAAREPSPPADLIEEELYDELADVSGQPALPPPSDPFYNVLEPEYLQPRHPSPMPIKTADEPADEGYGNSSGGSENDCHPTAEESHYKTLPGLLRPVLAARAAATSAPPIPGSGGAPAPPTAGGSRPSRPTQLPTAARPRAGTAGAADSGGTGSVADVIRRLNRKSVGDEEPAAAPPGPRQPTTPVSAELARKQALIAGGLRALTPTGNPAKPNVLPPKPPPPAGKPKPRPAVPVRQEAKPPGYGSTSRAGTGSRPGAGLAPNKSAVYKTMQRMSDSENRAYPQTGRQTDVSQAVTADPEEEDMYAEIDDDSWRT